MNINKYAEELAELYGIKIIPREEYTDEIKANNERMINSFFISRELEDINVNTIKIDSLAVALVGVDVGSKIFKEQIDPYFDYVNGGKIVFPFNIKKISISFIDSCFGSLVSKMGFEAFLDNVELVFLNEEHSFRIKDKIMKCL